MAAKRMSLNKRTFLVLSGSSNPLGQSLALQFARRLAPGSLALLLDADADAKQLTALRKQLEAQLHPTITVRTGAFSLSAQNGDQLLEAALEAAGHGISYERAIILHNEGEAATHVLVEPQEPIDWLNYVQQQLYAPVALNQRFLQCGQLAGVEKLVINVTSTLPVRPLVHSSLLCSCKRARDMYFRAMAAEEVRAGVVVLNYAAGLLETHVTQCDLNGNMVSLEMLNVPAQLLALPRVQPLQSTLKLINILEEITFVSGHDIDYYDTFVL